MTAVVPSGDAQGIEIGKTRDGAEIDQVFAVCEVLDRVGSRTVDEAVVAGLAMENIVARASREPVVAGAAKPVSMCRSERPVACVFRNGSTRNFDTAKIAS